MDLRPLTRPKKPGSEPEKVLSIVTPLIHGVSSLMSIPAAERSEHLDTSLAVMKAALFLTGTAAQNLTCRRRNKFTSFSHASKSYLLDTPKAFSKKEVSHHLFGERFERALTKAVKRSNTFAENGKFKEKPAVTASRRHLTSLVRGPVPDY